MSMTWLAEVTDLDPGLQPSSRTSSAASRASRSHRKSRPTRFGFGSHGCLSLFLFQRREPPDGLECAGLLPLCLPNGAVALWAHPPTSQLTHPWPRSSTCLRRLDGRTPDAVRWPADSARTRGTFTAARIWGHAKSINLRVRVRPRKGSGPSSQLTPGAWPAPTANRYLAAAQSALDGRNGHVPTEAAVFR